MEISQTNFSSLLKESIRELDSSKRTNCENITIEISQCPSSEELLGTGLEHPLELLSLHEKRTYSNVPRIPPSREGRCERRIEETTSSLMKIGKHGRIDLQ